MSENEKSELEQEFEALCASDASKQIDAKLDEARKALREAVELSEKHSIPFSAGISFLRNGYVPKSFTNSKFKELDSDLLSEITGVYDSYGEGTFEYGGWIHSAVC